MLSSKQRASLRRVAGTLEPIFQVGKDGLSEAQLKGMADALNKRELIKITVLKTSELSAKELIGIIAEKLDAQPVAAIGSKVIIYRRSDDKNAKHLEF